MSQQWEVLRPIAPSYNPSYGGAESGGFNFEAFLSYLNIRSKRGVEQPNSGSVLA